MREQRLILVDADQSVRTLVVESLTAQGFDCIGVSNLARAAALSERMSISGVLVNVGALEPELIDEMVEFRRQHPHLPLLAFDPPAPDTLTRPHLRLVGASDEAFTRAAGAHAPRLH